MLVYQRVPFIVGEIHHLLRVKSTNKVAGEIHHVMTTHEYFVYSKHVSDGIHTEFQLLQS